MSATAETPTILAAVDNSLASNSVLAAARALAAVLGAGVEGIHVRVDGDRTARSVAESAGVPLRIVSGTVVESLVAAGGAGSIVALAIGARGTPLGRRPLGGTATAVATRLAKPVLIVPPETKPVGVLRRVLAPIEGTLSTSLVPNAIFELARGTQVDFVALHVLDEASIPAFTDQPQHEQPAWAREFLQRYCPWGVGAVRLETRVGRPSELIPLVAEESRCDLIALAWSQELSAGRAPVVRGTLERSRLPVLLVPVRVADRAADVSRVGATGPQRR